MSEETEQRDYEALNAKTALDLNKAQQEIERLTALVKVLESDDHEWYLQAARIEKLKGDIQVLKLQRDATHVSRCPVCKETNDE